MSGLQHPEWLGPLGLGVATLALVLWMAGVNAGRRGRVLLGGGPTLPGVGRDLVLLAALAAIAAGLLGPRIGERTERVTASGVDVVLLLDVSRSMDAEDVAPSRLDRARRNALLVLSSLEPGDRVALAAFAGRGVLLTPLSPDHDALLDVLTSVDGELMRFRGSDLPGGVRAALGAYDPASLRPRVLMVLSDGEDPARAGGEAEAAAEAARAGVRILAVGIGSDGGSTVPDHGAPLRDARGEIVRSRRDLPRLAALAGATGGQLLPTDAFGALDPGEAVRAVRRDAGHAPGESTVRRVPAVQDAPLAALAFALLLGELTAAPALRARVGFRRRAPSLAATLLGVAFVLPSLAASQEGGRAPGAEVVAREAAAARAPRDASTLLRLGVARARAGLGPEAKRAFLAAALYARDPRLAATAYFDLGVASLEQGEHEAARDAFFDALALAPDDDEARFNLEWTLRALREGSPPPPPAGGKHPAPGPTPRADGEGGTGPGVPGAPGAGARGAAGETGSASRAGQSRRESTSGRSAPKAGDGRTASASGGGGIAAEAPVLDAAETARWLDAVQDDPGRALRDTVRAQGGAERAPAPAW